VISFLAFYKVIETPPYEVTETGWGEFEIMIKIYFVDPAEKHQTLYHHLQLYPKEEGGLSSQKAVVSEHYDEIVSIIIVSRF
jgi:YEATS domain-containing protein 4